MRYSSGIIKVKIDIQTSVVVLFVGAVNFERVTRVKGRVGKAEPLIASNTWRICRQPVIFNANIVHDSGPARFRHHQE